MADEFAETPGADVTDLPASTDTQADGSEQSPEKTNSGADDKAPEQKAPDDFSSIFDAAKTTAQKARETSGAEAEGDKSGAEGGKTDEEAKSSEKTSDEKVPGDEDDAEAEEKAASDAEKQAEAEGEKPKATDRSRKYQEIVEENTRLTGERDTAIAKATKIEESLAKHGGVDTVQQAMDIYDKLASGKANEVFADLPSHQRTQIQKEVFTAAIAEETNRVFGVNEVLKNDFGLSTDMSQKLMEKTFEYVAHRLNTDAADFEAYLDRELEFADSPEKRIARLEAENQRLKTAPKDGSESTEKTETELDIGLRVEKAYNEFEDATFKEIADAEFKAFGLEVSAKDTPAVKEAKELLADAVRNLVGYEMRTAKAFDPLLQYWVENDIENAWFKQAAGAYRRAMNARVQTTLKKLSKLFVARSANADSQKATNRTNAVPAPGGQGSQMKAPAGAKDTPGGGLRGAMQEARKAVGSTE